LVFEDVDAVGLQQELDFLVGLGVMESDDGITVEGEDEYFWLVEWPIKMWHDPNIVRVIIYQNMVICWYFVLEEWFEKGQVFGEGLFMQVDFFHPPSTKRELIEH
jgi:hypothetical protein